MYEKTQSVNREILNTENEKTQSVNREILVNKENRWENTISKQRNSKQRNINE